MTECYACGSRIEDGDWVIPLKTFEAVYWGDDDELSLNASNTVETVIHAECLQKVGGKIASSTSEEDESETEEEDDDEYWCKLCGDGPMSEQGVKVHQGRTHGDELAKLEQDYAITKGEEPSKVDLIKVKEQVTDDVATGNDNNSDTGDNDDSSNSDSDSTDGGEGSGDSDEEVEWESLDLEDEVIEAFRAADEAEPGIKQTKLGKALVQFFKSGDQTVYYMKSKQISRKLDGKMSTKSIAQGFGWLHKNGESYGLEVEKEAYSSGTTWKVEV